jgi:site-specific DNA-methyltransferase (adenine-specific)
MRSSETADKTDHPCPKPYGWMAWAICLASEDGETVLDPFMGSGTTLRAAKDLGRKAIGIEIEERYCEIAAKRMRQEVLPLAAIREGR